MIQLSEIDEANFFAARAGFADTGCVDPDAPDCLNLMYTFD